jgi:DNA-binding response OmpR family regulator
MPQPASSSEASSNFPLTAPVKVLVVDDDRDTVEMVKMLLDLNGGFTHAAYDGSEAVRLADELRPEIILLDIGLPKLNGYEACRQIRQHAWGRSMIVVALTGRGHDDDYARSQDSGFDMHLVKPVEPELLLTVLAATPRGHAPD